MEDGAIEDGLCEKPLRCRFHHCAYSILVRISDVDDLTKKERPEDRRLKNRLANLDKLQYVEYINHIKDHLIQLFIQSDQIPFDDAESLLHYEIHDYAQWTDYVNSQSAIIDAVMPQTCCWIFTNEEGTEEICDYHFTDLLDVLTHYYYHSHQVKHLKKHTYLFICLLVAC